MSNKYLHFVFISLFAILFSNCATTLYDQGRNSLSEGDYNKAVELLKQEVSANPQNYEAWRDLGIAEFKNNNLKDAETNLLKAYDLKKDDGETTLNIGLLYEKLEDYDKALSFYKNYTSISGGSADIIEGRMNLISRKKVEKEIKLALQNEDKLKLEPIPDNTIAVLYFQNIGGNKEYDALQKGLTEMLITDLSKVKSLKVVERVKLQKLMDEIKLSSSEQFDKSTAPRFGKLMKANKLVNGTFLNLSGDQFQVNAGFTSTSDGVFQPVKNVSGDINKYFKLQKELVFNIIDEMGIKISDEEREAIQVIPTESYLAFVAYSKGLDLEDRGLYGEAAEQFSQAFNIDPSFNQAQFKSDESKSCEKGKNDVSTINNSNNTFSTTTSDRLMQSTANLTGEVVTGKDDRNPNASAGFGRSVKVQFEIIIPK
ncbi:MAG: CsgG/HfaB family protein [Bacteroidota bacterium]|nr:CsgG/HfaB family protein [Bacteroidota bacterium]